MKVRDGRKQAIRGLWVRGSRFYARLKVEDPETGQKSVKRIPLEGVSTVAQAQAAMRTLMTQRDASTLPVTKLTPKFSEYSDKYIQHLRSTPDSKRQSTIYKESLSLNLWKAHFGDIRLNQITKARIKDFMAKRQGSGVSGRTVNLDIVALRNLLNHSIDDGWLRHLPTDNLRPLKWTAKRRSLVGLGDIEKVASAGFGALFLQSRLAEPGERGKPLQNAQQLQDYVKLMAFCGGRRSETLRITWTDVDWNQRQLTIGGDGQAKNRQIRVVDFNPALESHLKDMYVRRATDSRYLFPSSQRGDRDVPAKTLYQSLKLAREAAGIRLNFHDLRHFFASLVVMANVDFMTTAKWLGHQDGGVLIGKVYGHLADAHRKQMADKVVFSPVVVESQIASA